MPWPADTQAQSPADGSNQPKALEDVIESVSPAVALIVVIKPDGPGLGSGFLVHPLGVILTNNHVINEAVGGAVKLASGEFYPGFGVLASDPQRDLAVIRIDGFGLPALELGDSDSVRVGASVIAIGNPLGLESTVTTGVISGQRFFGGVKVFQLDAPISPGSSGGPIVSTDGRVIGLTVGQFQEGQNLNFAIPINYARGLLAGMSGEVVAVVPPMDEATFVAMSDSGPGAEATFSIEDYEEVEQRVAFAYGEDFAFLMGEISPRQVHTYVFEAAAEQLMRVEIEADDAVALRIVSPSEAVLDTQEGDSLLMAPRLYESGPYEVSVIARRVPASYKLLVEIR